ncbi:MAG: hypothetical protein WC593_15660 [Methanoregula sp.]
MSEDSQKCPFCGSDYKFKGSIDHHYACGTINPINHPDTWTRFPRCHEKELNAVKAEIAQLQAALALKDQLLEALRERSR